MKDLRPVLARMEKNETAESFGDVFQERVYYRLGQHESFLGSMNFTLQREASFPLLASDWFFLAMAQHRSEHKAEQTKARTSLARGIALMEADERGASPGGGSHQLRMGSITTSDWELRLMDQILRQEAEAELKKPAGK